MVDDSRAGRLSTSTTDDNLALEHNLLTSDHHLSIRMFAETRNIPQTTVQELATDKVGYRAVDRPPEESNHGVKYYFFLFPRIKTALKRTRFRSTTAIQDGVARPLTEVPVRIF